MLFAGSSFLIAATTALFTTAAVAAPISITVANPSAPPIGLATSSNLNTGLYRDGGGGGCVNGLCVAGFSDTTACNGPFQEGGSTKLGEYCKTVANNALGWNGFAHNTFATFDGAHRNANPNPPNALYDFGNQPGAVGSLVTAPLAAVTPDEEANGQFAIWPNGNMVPLSAGIQSNQVVGVANALTESGTDGSTLYNTMYVVTVTDDVPAGQNMPIQRIQPKLFSKDQNLYGTYSVMAGQPDDDCGVVPGTACLYLFARSDSSGKGVGPSGIKVARVPAQYLTDDTQSPGHWQYWDGKTWAATQPSASDTDSNIITSNGFLDTGEIFWSKYFGCYVHVSAAYGGFQISYAEDPTSLTGGWSQPQLLYSAEMPSDLTGNPSSMMYAGHSYPDWDETGRTLLLSWTCDEMWTQMKVVEFGPAMGS